MDATDAPLPEQGTPQTRAALESTTADLVAALQEHAQAVAGGDLEALFAANERVGRSVRAWDDRLLDHTGTSAVPLAEAPAEDEDEELLPVPGAGDPLSITTRFDVVVTDPGALVEAGRAAHLRTWRDDDEADAAEEVADPVSALYAVLHESGEPLYDVPGIEVVVGVRTYVAAESRLTERDVEDLDAPVVQPTGEVLLGESWA